MIYSQLTTGCKDNRLTPSNLEPKVTKKSFHTDQRQFDALI